MCPEGARAGYASFRYVRSKRSTNPVMTTAIEQIVSARQMKHNLA
jgi:hypothetical protein